MAKECMECGYVNNDDARFCVECGKELINIKEDAKDVHDDKFNNVNGVKGVISTLKSWWDKRSTKGKGVTICCLGILIIGLLTAMSSSDHTNSTLAPQIDNFNSTVNDSVPSDSNVHDTGKMVFEEPGEDWYIKNTDESDYVRFYRDNVKAEIDVILCSPYGDFNKRDELESADFKYSGYIGKGKDGNSRIELYKSQIYPMLAYVVTEGDTTFIIELTGPARDIATKIAKSIHSSS